MTNPSTLNPQRYTPPSGVRMCVRTFVCVWGGGGERESARARVFMLACLRACVCVRACVRASERVCEHDTLTIALCLVSYPKTCGSN
jgi:hypothetical protein